MTPPLSPKTYADVIVLARAAHILSWFRQASTLSLVYDDKAADRRSCFEVRIEGGKCGAIDVRTLSGFDPVKNCWGEYCAPQGTIALPDRRGLKDLLKFISEIAVEETGYANPEAFSRYTTEVAA
jgi:hypothetical protein